VLRCLARAQGMTIIPMTLEVGDYVLSPEICVGAQEPERPVSSFASGRLYNLSRDHDPPLQVRGP